MSWPVNGERIERDRSIAIAKSPPSRKLLPIGGLLHHAPVVYEVIRQLLANLRRNVGDTPLKREGR